MSGSKMQRGSLTVPPLREMSPSQRAILVFLAVVQERLVQILWIHNPIRRLALANVFISMLLKHIGETPQEASYSHFWL